MVAGCCAGAAVHSACAGCHSHQVPPFSTSLNPNYHSFAATCNPSLSGSRTFTCSKKCGHISIPREKAYCRYRCCLTLFTSFQPRCGGGGNCHACGGDGGNDNHNSVIRLESHFFARVASLLRTPVAVCCFDRALHIRSFAPFF